MRYVACRRKGSLAAQHSKTHLSRRFEDQVCIGRGALGTVVAKSGSGISANSSEGSTYSINLAEPEHPRALNWLILSFAPSCLVERTWRFAMPVLLANCTMAILPVALVGVFNHAGMILGGPLLGRWIDRVPRRVGLLTCLIFQNVGILCTGLLLWVWMNARSAAAVAPSGFLLLTDPIFLAIAICNTVEVVSAMGSDTAYEKDWVACLAGSERPEALARANSLLRQIDMASELAGPLIFVIVLDAAGVATTSLAAGIGLLAFLPLKLISVMRCVALAGPVLNRNPQEGHQSTVQDRNPMIQLKYQAKLYASIPTLRASFAWVLQGMSLFAPEGLLAAFLIKDGFSSMSVGLFRTACAVLGICGTLVSPHLIASKGLLWCGNSALRFQAACIIGAALCFSIHTSMGVDITGRLPIWLMLILVTVSKAAMWMYDIVAAQLFQTYVPNNIAATVGIMELTSLSLVHILLMSVSTMCGEVLLPVVLLSVIGVGMGAQVFSGLSLENSRSVRGHALDPRSKGPAVSLDPSSSSDQVN